MRYEHIVLDLTTRACDRLLDMVETDCRTPSDPELTNLANELRARLQRTDQDPQATVPNTDEGWLET
jgi:hypothetical protein